MLLVTVHPRQRWSLTTVVTSSVVFPVMERYTWYGVSMSVTSLLGHPAVQCRIPIGPETYGSSTSVEGGDKWECPHDVKNCGQLSFLPELEADAVFGRGVDFADAARVTLLSGIPSCPPPMACSQPRQQGSYILRLRPHLGVPCVF